MKKLTVLILFVTLTLSVKAQFTTATNGSWTDNASWTGVYPGTLSVNAGDDNLEFSSETITVDHYIITGSSGDRIDMTFTNSNDVGSLTLNDSDTLIIYGDVSFANKSMALNIGNNSVLIIMGDASFGNKVDVATSGTMVVSGNFDKAGSQGSYTGGGAVYAGSYTGKADDFIPGDVGTGGDQQQTLDDLSVDGFPEIEEFVNGNGSTPLPVELIYFNVVVQDHVNISWATASEINNDYFLVERSEDGSHFYEIGRVGGNGNSNEEIAYSFTDKFAFADIEYYRLKQVDYDGRFEYFEVKRINTGIVNAQQEISVYPTVVRNGQFMISATHAFQIQNISMYSLSGGETRNLSQNSVQENPLKYQVSTSQMNKGIYLLKVITSDGAELSTRIIID